MNDPLGIPDTLPDGFTEVEEHIAVHFETLLKSARRCAYDLRHAADGMAEDDPLQKIFSERANLWLRIFAPGGVKDYRLSMHLDLWNAERERDGYKKRLADAGLLDKWETE